MEQEDQKPISHPILSCVGKYKYFYLLDFKDNLPQEAKLGKPLLIVTD